MRPRDWIWVPLLVAAGMLGPQLAGVLAAVLL